jgi:hypothetical protein
VLRNADPELTQSLYDAFGVRLTTPNGTMFLSRRRAAVDVSPQLKGLLRRCKHMCGLRRKTRSAAEAWTGGVAAGPGYGRVRLDRTDGTGRSAGERTPSYLTATNGAVHKTKRAACACSEFNAPSPLVVDGLGRLLRSR